MAAQDANGPGKGLVGGQYRPLSRDHIGRIHETSLRVLDQVGVRVDLEEAREILAAKGARVDPADGRVRMKSGIVEKALRMAPSSVTLCGRKAEHHLDAGGRRTHFGTGGAAVKVEDLETQKVRASRLQDIADMARLVEALPNVHFFVRPCSAQDVPDEDRAVNEFYASLANTTKHVMGAAYTPEGAKNVVELGGLLAGSKEAFQAGPLFTVIVSWMNSPLNFDPDGTRTLLEVVRSGVPVALSSAPMAGATSPVTLAGTLVQLHAEELAGVVFTQMVRPGAPVIYGGIPSMADMRRLRYVGGGVEFGMMNAAIAQLSQYIRVPNYNSAGITEAKIPDIQAVYEKCFAILQCALSGSNIIHHAAGMLESLLTINYEQLVIDNEILGMALRAVRGIEVDEDTLAYDVIEEMAPQGNYLASEHTVRFVRTEYLEPMLADRSDRETWESLGMEGINEKARERVRDILSNGPSAAPREPLPQDLDREIRKRFSILLD
ncbi:MAG: trimethylamine methyltransferase family protein [Candidatus Brocadiia bacterium]